MSSMEGSEPGSPGGDWDDPLSPSSSQQETPASPMCQDARDPQSPTTSHTSSSDTSSSEGSRTPTPTPAPHSPDPQPTPEDPRISTHSPQDPRTHHTQSPTLQDPRGQGRRGSREGWDSGGGIPEQPASPDDPASPDSVPEEGEEEGGEMDTPASPAKEDRLSEISEGDSSLNCDLGDEEEEEPQPQKKKEEEEEEEEGMKKVDESGGRGQRSEGGHEAAQKVKRRSDEGLGLKDELDFEAERESGEEEVEEGEEGEEGEKGKRKVDVENREDGELSDDDDDDSLLRQEPKTVCRFFNKGQCTWGTNCRFLHPGVSDKGNYNMFAPPKPQSNTDKEEDSERGRQPREVRRFIPEPSPFESAWERGLRYAKEMMKRANKRKETDADFEEKRFNLSLGQAELDRENDYYTRPASPVFKQPDEIIDQYLDPYEKQAIRHFRGGHFENFEVRYNVDPRYNNMRGGHERSRRDKFEREVSERIQRRPRTTSGGDERYARGRVWQDDRYMEVASTGGSGRGEAEAWADPWARRKTPPRLTRKKKTSRTRSYSSGSSSRSSSSSSRSRSGSKSSRTSIASRSSHSSSHSPSLSPGPRRPPNARITAGRAGEKGSVRQPPPPMRSRPSPPPPIRGRPSPPPPMRGRPSPPPPMRGRPSPPLIRGRPTSPPMRSRPSPPPIRGRPTSPPMRGRPSPPPSSRQPLPRRPEARDPRMDRGERVERVDRFGRIRKASHHSFSRSRSRSRSTSRPPRRIGRTFSSSRSRSRSASRSTSATSRSRSRGRSISRSRSRSHSRSRSRSSYSRSSSASSVDSRRRAAMGDKRRMTQGTVSYGQAKSKAMDPVKLSGQKQQIKLTLKGPALKRLEKPVLPQEDDSGESDTGGAKLIRKRKAESPPSEAPPPKVTPRSPPPAPAPPPPSKKPQANRREELLKQLRAVEDAIARKRTKLPT